MQSIEIVRLTQTNQNCNKNNCHIINGWTFDTFHLSIGNKRKWPNFILFQAYQKWFCKGHDIVGLALVCFTITWFYLMLLSMLNVLSPICILRMLFAFSARAKKVYTSHQLTADKGWQTNKQNLLHFITDFVFYKYTFHVLISLSL